MRNEKSMARLSSPDLVRLAGDARSLPRHFLLGLILVFALLAFEMFNFDTTRYALESLLGPVRLAGLAWATILAIAFCAIDFAGLARIFTPQREKDQPREIWYLTGAWLLGASMNAVMTWWAVSSALLNHDLGNEVLSREQLLHIVPVFVAILVWLIRILFIGSVSAAGERILHRKRLDSQDRAAPPARRYPGGVERPAAPDQPNAGHNHNNELGNREATRLPRPAPGQLPADREPANNQGPARVGRRPPRPGKNGTRRPSHLTR
jgi:hypothetical protein